MLLTGDIMWPWSATITSSNLQFKVEIRKHFGTDEKEILFEDNVTGMLRKSVKIGQKVII